MRPRPIYRWKSFWLGLLTLVFMGWAWWDSFSNVTIIGCSSGSLALIDGTTYLNAHAQWRGLGNFGASRESPAGLMHSRLLTGDLKIGEVPDAAVFFPFLLAWTGWLAWRARKFRALGEK